MSETPAILEAKSASAILEAKSASATIELDAKTVLAQCPHIDSATTGWLSFLPEPWELRHGPIPVTLRCWSDGVVEADFADALLVGSGDDDASALDDLREQLALVLEHTTTTKATLAGAALRQHRAVLAAARRKPEAP